MRKKAGSGEKVQRCIYGHVSSDRKDSDVKALAPNGI